MNQRTNQPNQHTATRLYPAGTSLSDIPPGFRGTPFEQWRNEQLFSAPLPVNPDFKLPPAGSARTNYGVLGQKAYRFTPVPAPAPRKPDSPARLFS
jgi:hypothetical protein